MLYRAANTMDSMLGYKNAKYLYFGRVAARLDDVLNYIPARIAGFLFVIAAFFLRFDGRGAWRMLRRDAAKHPSPNGGHAEAPTAGALGIRLGGNNYYFGEPHFRAYMGEARREIEEANSGLEDRAPHVYGHDSFPALCLWRLPSLAAEGDAFLA